MARLSSRPPSGGKSAPIQVAMRGPLARNPTEGPIGPKGVGSGPFVKKSAAAGRPNPLRASQRFAKTAPRPTKASIKTQPRRGGRDLEDPLSGPLLR